MDPCGVCRIAPLVYSKFSPGRSTGWLPTTPSPRTSSRLPLPSVITQWRLLSWAVTVPRFSMRTVYANANRPALDCSGRKRLFTVTRMPWVMAVDICTEVATGPRLGQQEPDGRNGADQTVHHHARVRAAAGGVPPPPAR